MDIKEELYMMQPEVFVDPKGANKVCKLQRSIYGLVQAFRSWNIRFDEVIKAYGFIQTYGEACCRCQNRPISGRGSRTARLRIKGNRRQWGHNVYPGSGPLNGGKTLLPT